MPLPQDRRFYSKCLSSLSTNSLNPLSRRVEAYYIWLDIPGLLILGNRLKVGVLERWVVVELYWYISPFFARMKAQGLCVLPFLLSWMEAPIFNFRFVSPSLASLLPPHSFSSQLFWLFWLYNLKYVEGCLGESSTFGVCSLKWVNQDTSVFSSWNKDT